MKHEHYSTTAPSNFFRHSFVCLVLKATPSAAGTRSTEEDLLLVAVLCWLSCLAGFTRFWMSFFRKLSRSFVTLDIHIVILCFENLWFGKPVASTLAPWGKNSVLWDTSVDHGRSRKDTCGPKSDVDLGMISEHNLESCLGSEWSNFVNCSSSVPGNFLHRYLRRNYEIRSFWNKVFASFLNGFHTTWKQFCWFSLPWTQGSKLSVSSMSRSAE